MNNTAENEFGIPDDNPNIKKDKDGQPYRLIMIEEQEEMENFLPVGHNGVVFKIQRGVEVEVPQCVVDVLNDCVASRLVETGQDPVSGVKTKELRNFNRIPFRVIR